MTKGMKIYMITGLQDTFATPTDVRRLESTLKDFGTDVKLDTID